MITSRRTRPFLVAAAMLTLAWPAPAHAADEIGLSPDGATWSPQLAVVLFEADARWVPGDGETRSFQLRNQGTSPASMTVAAFSPSGDPVLASDVTISVRVDGATWTTLDLGAGPRPVTVAPVEVGRAVPVDVRAVFDPASANPTQNRVMPLTLRITLAGDVPTGVGPDDGAVGPDEGAAGTDSAPRGGLLPGTGTAVSPELVLGALALCAVGGLVIVRRSTESRCAGVDR